MIQCSDGHTLLRCLVNRSFSRHLLAAKLMTQNVIQLLGTEGHGEVSPELAGRRSLENRVGVVALSDLIQEYLVICTRRDL